MQQLAPRPSRHPLFVPYGLYDLWDIMLKTIPMNDFFELGEETAIADHGLVRGGNCDYYGDKPEQDSTLYDALNGLTDMCRRLGARRVRELFENRIKEWDRDGGHGPKPESAEIDLLVEAFKRELKDRVFLYMPAADAEFYQSKKLLSATAKAAFPKLAQELKTAGNAYACGLATASVFHCMRALEHALAALAVDVGLRWEKEQWHNIIELIESRIRELSRTLPMGLAKDERINFLSQAAKEFMYFKDGWRNYVAHNRITYSLPDALEVIEHVQAFTEKLSAALRE